MRASALLVLLATAPAARAQYQVQMASSDGISVSGSGELSAKPNMVEVDLHISGKAELTGDALVKYRDTKKRVTEALEKLKIKSLSTDELGLSISAGNSLEQQQRMMNGQAVTNSKTQIEVSSTLRVRVKDVRDLSHEDLIKTVGKLLDTAQDSGVTIGPNPAEVMRAMRYGNYTNNAAPVRFVVTDLAALREKAYEQAVADARTRATRLAKLNQVKLGPALSVQEVMVSGDQATVMPNQQNTGATIVEDEDDEPRITSTALSGIPVIVKLMVRFAIADAGTTTARKD